MQRYKRAQDELNAYVDERLKFLLDKEAVYRSYLINKYGYARYWSTKIAQDFTKEFFFGKDKP